MQIHSNHDDRMLSEINVTPLVDVMLVLLVIFMVTAPLIQQGIAVNLPESEATQPLAGEEEDVIVTVKKGGSIYIDKYKTDVKGLKPKLRALFENRREKKIFIKADRSVSYGLVVKVMGMAKAAGVERVGMITEMPERGG